MSNDSSYLRKYVIGSGALVVIVTIQQFASFPVQNSFTNSLTNWMHVPMFAALTGITMYLWPKWKITVLIGVLAGIALATEAMQFFTGREPSVADLAKDALGAGLGLLVARAVTLKTKLLGVMVITLVTAAVPGTFLLSYAYQQQMFPVLFDPHDTLRSRILNRGTSALKFTSLHPWKEYLGEKVVALTWDQSSWPGISISETIQDWHAYEQLKIDVYNIEAEQQPLTISVRHIRPWGTSNRIYTVSLQPGNNQISVNLKRLLYLDDGTPALIKHLKLYTTPDHAGKRILLGRVWLN